MLHKKEKLYKIYIKNPTGRNKTRYKNYRNKLNKLLHAVEKDYYHQKFESTTHDIKKTWQVIKTIIGKNTLSVPVESFRSNNTTISDKSEIVDKFNKFFVNIGPTLANKISASQVCYSSFLKGDYSNSFSLFFTDPTEIIIIIIIIKSHFYSGLS